MIRDLTIGDRTYAQYVPPDMEEIRAYFEAIARDVMASSSDVWTAGPSVGQMCLHPGGRDRATGTFYYPGIYERDALYCFKTFPELFPPAIIAEHVAVWFSNQQPDGSFFDGVTPGNTAVTYLGRGVSSLDCIFDLVYHCFLHFERTGLPTLYNLYKTQIADGLAAVLIDNHLVYVTPGITWPADWPFAEYGFQDSIRSRGHVLMCSVLRFRAFRQLAAMAVAAGDPDIYSAELPLITAAIESTLSDPASGWLLNATQQCVQHSIPGSLYAVVVGCVTPERREIIAQTAYDSLPGHSLALAGKWVIYNGQPIHIPANENWDSIEPYLPYTVIEWDYQNKGAWSTFTGDYAQVLRIKSPAAARKLVEDLYLYTRSQTPANRPTEAASPVTGWLGAPVYCASVAMVLWNGFEDKDS